MKNKLRGIVSIFAVVFGLMMFAGVAVNAQTDRGYYNDNDRYGQNDRYRYDNRYDNVRSDRYRQAMERGYRDGFRMGQADARHRQSYSMESSNDYRNSSNGYNQGWGSRGGFERAYREGFRRGYHDGYAKGQRGRGRGIFDF